MSKDLHVLPRRRQVWALLRRIGVVGLIYGGSILGFLLAELLMSRHMSRSAFGGYQLARNALPFAVAVTLLGFDQILARQLIIRGGGVVPFDRRQVRLVSVSGSGGLLLGAVSWWYFGIDWSVLAAMPIFCFCFAVTSIVAAKMRAAGNYNAAAATQQGYRLVGALFFVALLPVVNQRLAIVSLGGAALVVMVVALRWNRAHASDGPLPRNDYLTIRRLGRGFSVSTATIALTDWLDQALLARLGDGLSDVGQYAVVKLLTVYPLLSLGSIVGFIALPEIARRRSTLTVTQLHRSLVLGVAAVIGGAALLYYPLEYLLNRYLAVQPSHALVAVLLSTGAIRLYYVLPSSYLGAIGGTAELYKFGGLTVIAIAVQVTISIVLAVIGMSPPVACGMGLFASVLCRCLFCIAVCTRSVRRLEAQSGHESLVGVE